MAPYLWLRRLVGHLATSAPEGNLLFTVTAQYPMRGNWEPEMEKLPTFWSLSEQNRPNGDRAVAFPSQGERTPSCGRIIYTSGCDLEVPSLPDLAPKEKNLGVASRRSTLPLARE